MRAAELARALGAKRSGRQYSCRCPAHDDSEPSLIFWDGTQGAIRFKCYAGCAPLDVIAALRARGLWATDNKPENDHRDLAAEIWRASRSIASTAAEYYLALRGLTLPVDLHGRVARFHPNCPRGKTRVPALVVLFRTLIDNVPCAIQRIFLTPDYKKDGKPMMLGPTGDAAMKLNDSLPITSLTICEGFETGLALMALGYAPVWALGSAGAIARFPLIEAIDELIVAVDHDTAGKDAADEVMYRWGARARGIMIDQPGCDFADYYAAQTTKH